MAQIIGAHNFDSKKKKKKNQHLVHILTYMSTKVIYMFYTVKM